jgi:hypothetical protein
MNYKGYGCNQQSPNLKYFTEICLKNRGNHVKPVSLPRLRQRFGLGTSRLLTTRPERSVKEEESGGENLHKIKQRL